MPGPDPALVGRHANGSPLGVGDAVFTAHMKPGEHHTAVDVQPVMKENATAGWVYTSDHGQKFYQENTAVRGTLSGGIKIFSKSESAAVPEPLDAGHTQLPPGSTIGRGLSTARDAATPHDPGRVPGTNYGGSPYAIGDMLPTGEGRFTTVKDINAVVNRDTGLVHGFLYEGADGEIYKQLVDPQPLSASVSVGPIGVGGTFAVQGPIEKSDPPGALYGLGQIPSHFVNNQRIPMVEGAETLGIHPFDKFKPGHQHAMAPSPLDAVAVGDPATITHGGAGAEVQQANNAQLAPPGETHALSGQGRA